MIYARPNQAGAKVQFKAKYGNFINGEWVQPVKGQYFENISPVTGQPFCDIPRSTAEDIEVALDAAHQAKDKWGKTSPAERALLLNKMADVMEQNLEMLAVAETWDNGKPIRETLAAALAAGNCVVIKPAEQTPWSILVLAELIQKLLPPGIVNIVNGFGAEAGKPLASNKRIAKIAFTGETTTGRLIMQYASENLIPVTLELGGKSMNIFFSDVMSRHDSFL